MTCPLCSYEEPELHRNTEFGNDFATIEGRCRTCGQVKITEDAVAHLPAEERYKLSAFFRRLGTAEDVQVVTAETWRDCIKLLPVLTPTERFDDLLYRLAQLTPRLGGPAEFSLAMDYPLVMARDPSEADLMVKA